MPVLGASLIMRLSKSVSQSTLLLYQAFCNFIFEIENLAIKAIGLTLLVFRPAIVFTGFRLFALLTFLLSLITDYLQFYQESDPSLGYEYGKDP